MAVVCRITEYDGRFSSPEEPLVALSNCCSTAKGHIGALKVGMQTGGIVNLFVGMNDIDEVEKKDGEEQ